MHDASLTSVFADPRMAEILVRRHAPEWACEVALPALRTESTGLVSRKTLQQRRPDMIWSADTVNPMPYRTFTRNQLLVSFLSRMRSARTGQYYLESRGEGVRSRRTARRTLDGGPYTSCSGTSCD